MAHAVDAFHLTMGGGPNWVLPEVEMLELAGGFAHDDMVEGDEEKLSSDAMDVDEEDEEDEEVRKVRLGLAQTTLGGKEEERRGKEEMDVDRQVIHKDPGRPW